MKKILKYIPIFVLIILPLAVHAEDRTFQEIASDMIIRIANYALVLLVALTVLVFMYGLMKYMFKGQESDEARSDGRKFMLWGIIGLFVMTSIWGLVGILANTIGQNQVGVPQFKTSGTTQNTASDLTSTSGTTGTTGRNNTNNAQSNTRVGQAVNTTNQTWNNFRNNLSNLWSRLRGTSND